MMVSSTTIFHIRMVIKLDNMRLIYHDLFGDFGQAMALLEFKSEHVNQAESFINSVFQAGQQRWLNQWQDIGPDKDKVALPFAQDQSGRLHLYAYSPTSAPPVVLGAQSQPITTCSEFDSMDTDNVFCVISLWTQARFVQRHNAGRQQFAIHAHLRAMKLCTKA